MNQYDTTLIQDTSDFFYYTLPAFREVMTEGLQFDSAGISKYLRDPWPIFYSWVFAHQIERVFDLTCQGHRRRAHPNVHIVDQVRNLIDLDAITKATIIVPKVYNDRELKVWLWDKDLVIQHIPTELFNPLKFGNINWKPALVRVLPLHHSSNN